MLDHHTPEASMALAKARHQAALEDAAAYRLLSSTRQTNSARRWRDRMGDWLIHAGHRLKTGNVAPETQPYPTLVHRHRQY